jgi:hypothetical protein
MSRLVLADEDYYRSHITDMLPLRWMAVESMENLKFTLKTDVWYVCIFLDISSGKAFGSVHWLMCMLAPGALGWWVLRSLAMAPSHTAR